MTRPLAAALFERSLQAARRLGEPHVLARTLLMAGWVPFWSNDLPTAEAMFREALEAARSAEGGDPWGESRALVGIANVISPAGDEEEALRVGLEALAVGEDAGQAFTAAVAHETVAASLRRLMRLDEGLEHSEAAIRTFRELGARWELASALGDRGATYRLAGRLEEAETDLREAFVLCRDLQERALVTWTAAELARILATRGDPSSARQVLSDPTARLADGEPGSSTALLTAECLVALVEGRRGHRPHEGHDRDRGRGGPRGRDERVGGAGVVGGEPVRIRCRGRRGCDSRGARPARTSPLEAGSAGARSGLRPAAIGPAGSTGAQGFERSARGWLHRPRTRGSL